MEGRHVGLDFYDLLIEVQSPSMREAFTLVTLRLRVQSRVESRTGAVALASRWRLDEAFASPASVRFGLTLFPVPARRTGQADFPHPALGKDAHLTN